MYDVDGRGGSVRCVCMQTVVGAFDVNLTCFLLLRGIVPVVLMGCNVVGIRYG